MRAKKKNGHFGLQSAGQLAARFYRYKEVAFKRPIRKDSISFYK